MECLLVTILIHDVLKECTDETVELMTVLELVGGKLWKKKGISNENQLFWLAGMLLDGNYRMSVPPRMRAPDLIRGHFFEPSITADMKGDPIFNLKLSYWQQCTSLL